MYHMFILIDKSYCCQPQRTIGFGFENISLVRKRCVIRGGRDVPESPLIFWNILDFSHALANKASNIMIRVFAFTSLSRFRDLWNHSDLEKDLGVAS